MEDNDNNNDDDDYNNQYNHHNNTNNIATNNITIHVKGLVEWICYVFDLTLRRLC